MRKVLFISLLFAVVESTLADQDDSRLEESFCGVKEPVLFWLWSSMAGRPDKDRLLGLSGVEDISIRTRDGRILWGYKLGAALNKPAAPKGYILVVQGNAILADQILSEFKNYSIAGYDVFIFDFRGYGRSEGKRRLKAIVGDYREILTHLNALTPNRRFVYAISLGGIIILNALVASAGVDKVVIDSSPSRLSDYGCPTDYDPVLKLPADCSNFLFIMGGSDHVVSPDASRELAESAELRGATVERVSEFGHPFMDSSGSVHTRRFELIENYLLEDGALRH